MLYLSGPQTPSSTSYSKTKGPIKIHIPLDRMSEVRDHLIPRQSSYSCLDPFSIWTLLENDSQDYSIAFGKEGSSKDDQEDWEARKEGYPRRKQWRDCRPKRQTWHVCPESNETTTSLSEEEDTDTSDSVKTSSRSESLTSSPEKDTEKTRIEKRRKNKVSEGGLEMLCKTEDDEWIVLRRSDNRSLFAMLSNHKNLNLEEVAQVCSQSSTSTRMPSNSSNSAFLPFSHLFQWIRGYYCWLWKLDRLHYAMIWFVDLQ